MCGLWRRKKIDAAGFDCPYCHQRIEGWVVLDHPEIPGATVGRCPLCDEWGYLRTADGEVYARRVTLGAVR